MKSFDLSKLFWSKTRAKLLEKFFLEYDAGNSEGFYMRELARDLDEQINSIKRELDSFEEMGILKSKEDGNKKLFYISRSFVLLDDFRNIFLKSYNPFPYLKAFFKKQSELDIVIVHEELTRKLVSGSNNIVDIFLIGDMNKIEFNNFLAKTFFNRKIKYAIITTDDFRKRIEFKDKLIFNIMRQPGNVFFKDTLDVQKLL